MSMTSLSDIFNFTISLASDRPQSYTFLVVAALQEELDEFYSVASAQGTRVNLKGGAVKVTLKLDKTSIDVLTFTPNQMGMPINAADVMNIHSVYKPVYTLFIGTCASLTESERQLGDVLIPNRVYSWESGKYKDGKFQPDFASYQTGNYLRKEAEHLRKQLTNLGFQVITDEDMCSGSAVVDDKQKRDEVVERSSRKATGLDMEAFAAGCINHVLSEPHELLVIKAISDFAVDKGETEKKGNKDLAKKNAAKFALEMIKHLHNQTKSVPYRI
jgi:nucleoside phosphorylase